MVWLGGLITLVSIVLWVYAFFDALTTPSSEVRTLPKVLWVFVIVLFVPVGAILWLLLGRPRQAAAPRGSAPSPTQATASADDLDPSDFTKPSGSPHPLGPDDDPEFLRRLNRRIDPED
ncbi:MULTISPECIES: PLD nuclease N-terminal domain-containing protein [Nocardiopsis]|uniref:PLD nuclease N-terminal domain-containing protein n=1 Tax=Nocardiopsis TaxID=2013 RepID=UPI00200BCF52|nr:MULTISPECIES: PLD nuclease N-terminal domain-containing protein [Nocardiopsis]MCK9872501.1 PLD nuclease N-terminal domain-containing protein [Nocardiopsis dassonvillei]WDZ91546.1 PLD nuclease N-terminal domain-containing protein [Nocardiopsis sp. HUAS JQ3]